MVAETLETSFENQPLTPEKWQETGQNSSQKMTAKILSDSEQLEEMSRKNPAFARLRDELKLDVY